MIIPLMYTQPVLTIQMIEMKFIWFSNSVTNIIVRERIS